VATESVAGFMTSADKVKLNTASLTALSGLTPAASKIPYFSGADSAALADITATGISLLGAANAAGARTTLELGTVATQAADSVSLTGGSISGMTSISGSTLTSTVVTGTAPFSVTSTTLVANLNTDTVDGFHASQTPGADQIPVLNSSGRLVLDGTDDGSSKIQTGGVIKATGLKLSDTNEIKWGDGSCKISGSGSTDIITLTGNLSVKNIYGAGLAVINYSGANSTGGNVWIGGGGASSIGESGATYKGSGNLAVGASALNSATTAYWSTALGYAALYGITTGHSNTALGYAAGRFISGGSVLNTASTGSLYLGVATKAGTDGNTNEIVIGFDTTGMGSNTAILGNSSITRTYLRGRVLAGPTLPTDNGVDALQVNGTIASTGYKLSALNTAPASASATGTLGEIRITADAIYICTATNTWKKVAIATW